MTDTNNTKKCSKCKEIKSYSSFASRKEMLCGYDSTCYECKAESSRESMRTRKGLVLKIYCKQLTSSKVRNHPKPEYTLDELRRWVFRQPNFNKLYYDWVQSGYDKKLTPSCDRLDDYQHYFFDNLRLVTWQENDKKGTSDIKNGINNKQSKSIEQLTLNGDVINTYYSLSEAQRRTGISIGNISMCCSGKRNKASGFKWRFNNG